MIDSSIDFDAISISLSNSDDILSWSHGEVKKPETINYRTFKPENDGLFCARIFGPIRDYECLCGKYKRIKYQGVVCEKCGVEVIRSRARRERMGHITLASPIVHTWFLRSIPSHIGLLLKMSQKILEQVAYFEQYIVIDPGITNLQMGQLLSESHLDKLVEQYGEDSFCAETGAVAIRKLLASLDLKAMCEDLKQQQKDTKVLVKLHRIMRRLKVIEAFMSSDNKPEWMIMDILPVLPPDLRPLVPLDGGRFATSDLNDLYRRVINRNNRLKRLLELSAPRIIVRNEQRMLQEAVDSLFDNSRRARPATSNKRVLRSLTGMLKGKQGRFRQNLLGKRVDYSGRSVIVVGPQLELNQCGIPKEMALELFKPYIFARLEAKGKAMTLKVAKKIVEQGKAEVWDILADVVREHPLLLNRAPTLHRLSIQAFDPVLVEGKAIQLHPLVCTAFNADFDGDQMAVHVPLSLEAKMESRVLMMSTNNILSPANGQPIIVPSQDIVLGIYYLTTTSANAEERAEKPRIFTDIAELEHALYQRCVTLHTPIYYSDMEIDEQGKKSLRQYSTTVGRVILSDILPKNSNIDFSLINRTCGKKEITDLLSVIYRNCTQRETVKFCDQVMGLGFTYACKSGISFGRNDMIIPKNKTKLINESRKKIEQYEKQWLEGLITQGEKYNKTIDVWSQCTDKVESNMIQDLSDAGNSNSIYMMWQSGARGSSAQIKQLSGMRGLMAKTSGEIIETPIVSNFKEGLNMLEYFNSTHGARKGLADTALKTANSGYLTRRLVDVAQDCTVVNLDCGATNDGIIVRYFAGSIMVNSDLTESVLGRIAARDIVNPKDNSVIVKAGQEIDEDKITQIRLAKVEVMRVRSVLTCDNKLGVCCKCYGRDLARGKLVSIGESVGIIAAQSIGEPGTQLTMRTFHIGGTAQIVEESNIIASCSGTIKTRSLQFVTDQNKNRIVLSKNGNIMIMNKNMQETYSYRVPYGAVLFIKDGDTIAVGDKIAEWDPYTIPVVAAVDGVVQFKDLIDGVSVLEQLDESTGISAKVIADSPAVRRNMLSPSIIVCDAQGLPLIVHGHQAIYPLHKKTILSVEVGQQVKAGTVLARIPRETSKTKDITGGLPRVVDLFEARIPHDAAIISHVQGVIKSITSTQTRKSIIIETMDNNLIKVSVPRNRHIIVQQGDRMIPGDYLVDGTLCLHDILEVLGQEKLTEYFVAEVQKIYRLQGVLINDKHIEIILKQMLNKVLITWSGDSSFMTNELIDRQAFEEELQRIKSLKADVPKGKIKLLGVTRASLQTRSFISAAAFQDTSRILAAAAVAGRKDNLLGIKENVIVGRLIPAGTGLITKNLRDQAVVLAKQSKVSTEPDITKL